MSIWHARKIRTLRGTFGFAPATVGGAAAGPPLAGVLSRIQREVHKVKKSNLHTAWKLVDVYILGDELALEFLNRCLGIGEVGYAVERNGSR